MPGMKHYPLVAVAVATLMLTTTAQTAPVRYSWTGYGVNVPGSSKCPSYKMTIDVTVDGTNITARFEQEGRPQRHFEATLDAQGGFKTTAVVGGGNIMQVSGAISGAQSHVLLDGYCKFGGNLAPK